jgi:hypothetical protein
MMPLSGVVRLDNDISLLSKFPCAFFIYLVTFIFYYLGVMLFVASPWNNADPICFWLKFQRNHKLKKKKEIFITGSL